MTSILLDSLPAIGNPVRRKVNLANKCLCYNNFVVVFTNIIVGIRHKGEPHVMESHVSAAGIILRFILGGGAVVASTLVARWLGGKAGGLFAAFPAVFLAALLTSALAQPSPSAATAAALSVSQGAMVGMTANVVCALCTARLVKSRGWKAGLALGLAAWAVVASFLFVGLRLFGFIA